MDRLMSSFSDLLALAYTLWVDSYNSKVKLPEPKTFPNVKLIEPVPRPRPLILQQLQPITAPPPYPSKPQHTEKLNDLERKDIHFG